MQTRIEKLIESHVYNNGKNVCDMPQAYLITAGIRDTLPAMGTHYVEASLADGSDEIEVCYTLTKYEAPNATYTFEVVK